MGEPFVGKSQVNSCLGRERGEGGENRETLERGSWGEGPPWGGAVGGGGWGGGVDSSCWLSFLLLKTYSR